MTENRPQWELSVVSDYNSRRILDSMEGTPVREMTSYLRAAVVISFGEESKG